MKKRRTRARATVFLCFCVFFFFCVSIFGSSQCRSFSLGGPSFYLVQYIAQMYYGTNLLANKLSAEPPLWNRNLTCMRDEVCNPTVMAFAPGVPLGLVLPIMYCLMG